MSAEKKELIVSYKIGENEIKLTPSIVQQYIVGSNTQITMSEFKLFTELCKVNKLNPFLKECYCVKYGSEPATIVVSKDVVIKRAVLHPQYDGKESGVIVQNADSGILERAGCFVAANETLVGGWARVWRKDRTKPEYMSVSLSEVAKKKRDGSLNSNWANQPATMVEKVAKVRALREAFVDEMEGMSVSEDVTTQEIIDGTCNDIPLYYQKEEAEEEQVDLNDL